MRSYKNGLRSRLRGRTGIIEIPQPYGAWDDLDEAIVMEAEHRLDDVEWYTFQYAYHCLDTWHDIHEKLVAEHGRKLTRATVERYGRRALEELNKRFDEIQLRLRSKRMK